MIDYLAGLHPPDDDEIKALVRNRAFSDALKELKKLKTKVHDYEGLERDILCACYEADRHKDCMNVWDGVRKQAALNENTVKAQIRAIRSLRKFIPENPQRSGAAIWAAQLTHGVRLQGAKLDHDLFYALLVGYEEGLKKFTANKNIYGPFRFSRVLKLTDTRPNLATVLLYHLTLIFRDHTRTDKARVEKVGIMGCTPHTQGRPHTQIAWCFVSATLPKITPTDGDPQDTLKAFIRRNPGVTFIGW